ncbi:MAG TPA: MAPEG family protein [Steroidobacteraceae bacterium]|nr:MAPEG family protein [Steroidobacteraceae bacterium]
MSRDWIFVPVIFQVFLTLFVYLRLLQVKKRAVAEGRVDRTRVALRDDAWPDYVIQVNNNIRNQFELPVLFYVLAIMLWLLDSVHGVAVAAATAFVLSRIVHAGIHLSINAVPPRRHTFTVGWVAVLVMAVLVFWELVRRAEGLGPT